MWSGPRNISTAMMRAWENRPDTAVCDEPLYGYYLHTSGSPHPHAEEIMAAQGTDWRRIVESVILGPAPEDKPVFFQKHMTHHLLPEVEREWFGSVTHCFLIRDPEEVLISYAKQRSEVLLEDVGIIQQAEIFDDVCERAGAIPPVLDARHVLENPERTLRLLCDRLDVPFSERMLSWPAGRRASDGVWAKHWYASVERSTGFAKYTPKNESPPPALKQFAEECEPHYRRLYDHRLR
ncbi:MAG: HAD family hydrolase [Gammaproteobacteria bacterium]